MEDIEQDWVFDILKAKCHRLAEIGEMNDSRIVSLPVWTSSDGYKMLEDFTASRKSKKIKDLLLPILARKVGVFRAFKDALAEMPDVQNDFSRFRMQVLGKEIRLWNAELMDANGYEGFTPGVVPDISYEEFSIGECEKDLAIELVNRTVDEAFNIFHSFVGDNLKKEIRAFISAHSDSRIYVAENAAREIGAIAIWAFSGATALVRWIRAFKEYEKLGLDAMLVEKIKSECKKHGFRSIVLMNAPKDLKTTIEGEILFESFSLECFPK